MLEDARDEVIAKRAHAIAAARIVHAGSAARRVPQAEVDVRAVAGLTDEGLGRERSPESVAVSDGPHRLTIEDLAVGGFERRRVANGQLLLAVAELGVVLLDK